ncbi:HAMP domain-containing sensor histidine kinase [Sporichthya sp.]|uniref:sensor histidine kinase n=1 Tax=Sporichthya sp. TaxID=65475 RepID=UPI0017CD6996|nr:HAMP domain-containing sensor histidine kinase [Sporichthya sp.]MBA3743483.1 HAMP domain-containing histidine kinase [Sporichthya sp.]
MSQQDLPPAGPPGAEPKPRRHRRVAQQLAGTMWTRLSLRVRVAAFITLVVGATVAITSLAVWVTVRVQYYNSFDDTLVSRARALLQTPAADPTQVVRFPEGTFAAAGTRLAIVYPDGTPFFSKGPDDAPPTGQPELEVALGASDFSLRTVRAANGEKFRVVAIPSIRESEPRTAFVLAQTTRDVDRTLRSLATALLVIGGAGVGLAAYAGVYVARQGLRPVSRLTEAAEHVARTGELRPIDVHGGDELARLGSSFNKMLTAVERSRDLQRRLVGDAGHELRTPLTSLRTNLDLLAQAEGRVGLSATDRAELLDDVRAQAEELTGLVGDLVELSRDEVDRFEGRELDMAEIVSTATERARRRAPTVQFDVTIRPWTVYGDARALERAVLNLLDNAGKWSPPGGTVTVRLTDGVITVTDQGPGIAEADLPFVFDRFYRAEESRTMPGSGLGLAIVRQAAERHGGSVTADRAPGGGALLKMRLPHSSSVTHTDL